MGVVVSGDALQKVFGNDKITPKFIELVEQADVVLACRVSPKQKAEIVQMVRDQHKDAITMGIGDGANDVNMITQAHVGIGIEGLEGMQAARASDYVISQFKFLRPLIFYHGREAYRRNAILVIYNFYKNNLFVMPQYWFGFASAFSGQTLYESIIYQGYNTVFTAFPIMWFAIFDEEFSKKTFLTEPKHYWIGLKDEYYTFKLLTLNVIKGIFVGLMITLLVFCSLNGFHIAEPGFNGSFWMSSAILYGVVVIDANVYVMQVTCTHTWPSTALILASILSYFFLFWLENLFTWSGPMYTIFGHTMSDRRTYMVFLINTWLVIAMEMIFNRWYDWRVLQMKKHDLQKELNIAASISDFTSDNMAGLTGRPSHTIEMAGSFVQRETLLNQDGEARTAEDIRRTQSLHMELEREASNMGDKNPILSQRRGTAKGFAFSQDVGYEPAQQRVEDETAEIVEETSQSMQHSHDPNLNLR